jgi:phosphatidylinositol alpha-1,6-mannosyltransferase
VEPSLIEGAYRLYRALRIARRNDVDVLVGVGKQAVWVGAALSALTGTPLVAVGAGSEFLSGQGMSHVLTRWAFGRARRMIAISGYARELAYRAGIGRYRTSVVHCGADAGLYHPGLPTDKLRQRLGLGSAPVILTVGQLSERKAQDVVIRALVHITRDCPDVVYLTVGLPTQYRELQQLAKQCGVDDHVRFLGQMPQDQLPLFYNLADVFVLVSRRTEGEVEGYGIVVAEAALCGVPAVVASGSGLIEAVIGEETALIVSPDDPDATGRAIVRLLKDDELRQRMGSKARQHALESATWERRVRGYDRILRTVVRDAR